MSRRVTLVALWAVFAVASVSVGFAAASMVSDPFTDVNSTSEVSDLAGPGGSPFTEPGGSASANPTGSPSASTGTSKPSNPSSGGAPSAGTTKPPNDSQASVKRGISTRGGYISATCRGGLVSMGAAPAVYWVVKDRTPGRAQSGEVRLESAHDANGERVEVSATCPGGTPAFTTEYSDSGGGGSSGSGSDDGGSG